MSPRLEALGRAAIPAAALVGCALTDPDDPKRWIPCPFRIVTGHPCPTCGLTRGVASLLRLRGGEALGFHWLSPVAAAVLGAWLVYEMGAAAGVWRGRPLLDWARQPSPWIGALAVLLGYGALRWWGIIGSPPA